MSTTASAFLDRHYFLLRRLHSLTGVVPVGVFLFPHLTTNSSIVWGSVLGKSHADPDALAAVGAAPHAGVETFQHEVDFIHSLPALVLLEIGLIFLPLAFHALVGIWFATSARYNADRYRYGGNLRYTLQRLSGYLALVFVVMHITSLRFGLTWGGLLPVFDPQAASSTTAVHMQESPLGLLVPAFYALSVIAIVFHFANGLWTAAITWGLTVSRSAQQRWGWVCAAIGILLTAAGLTAVAGFATLDIDQAVAIEQVLEQQKADPPVPGEGTLEAAAATDEPAAR